MKMGWRQKAERALSIDAERAKEKELAAKVRDALWHSSDEKELRERLQAILAGSRSAGE
jgi:hypothetical protein